VRVCQCDNRHQDAGSKETDKYGRHRIIFLMVVFGNVPGTKIHVFFLQSSIRKGIQHDGVGSLWLRHQANTDVDCLARSCKVARCVCRCTFYSRCCLVALLVALSAETNDSSTQLIEGSCSVFWFCLFGVTRYLTYLTYLTAAPFSVRTKFQN
jgi:hypothetical protein